MYSDVSSCNTYNYGDALYWDVRYVQEAESFDWYQRYASLRPFVRRHIPASSRVLMVGCGNALMSEDMVDDGYENIMNVDISSVAIDLMRRKYEQMPQLKYMEMDVRDMSFFPDESFDAVIDKGTLDSLMCGSDAPISAARMLGEVSRLLKPGGIYMLITYGDPKVRMPHLSRSNYSWKIVLYAIPRPGFKKPAGSSSISHLEPVPITETGSLPADFVLDDPDSHFIYVCKKMGETTGPVAMQEPGPFRVYSEAKHYKNRYSRNNNSKEEDILKHEIAKLQVKQLRLLGTELTRLSFKESSQHLEKQLKEGLLCVKEKKEQRVTLENETLRRQARDSFLIER